jgi:cytochrome c peroxidase
MSRARMLIAAIGSIALFLALTGATIGAGSLTSVQELGKAIFFDEDLSLNSNQSCASCHGPDVGFTGPQSDVNAHGAVYEGSIAGAFGNRKPPSAAYVAMSPVLHQDRKGTWIGGAFWDGRATGSTLGSPTAEQAQGPFLNPREQALPNSASVVERVCAAAYGVTFRLVWGEDACDDPGSPLAYEQVARSIAAYEASAEVNPFSSKYDLSFGRGARLTPLERRGMGLFNGKGGCRACHPDGKGGLFTDYSYDNLGVPKNPENPVYTYDPTFVDEGLGATLKNLDYPADVYTPELGKQKVPTLRNVALAPSTSTVKAYMHNGYFKSLEQVVHFYNTRDVLPTCPSAYSATAAMAADCWPAPEVPETVNHEELGNLGLSPEDEAAIVAFLETLSDGYDR